MLEGDERSFSCFQRCLPPGKHVMHDGWCVEFSGCGSKGRKAKFLEIILVHLLYQS